MSSATVLTQCPGVMGIDGRCTLCGQYIMGTGGVHYIATPAPPSPAIDVQLVGGTLLCPTCDAVNARLAVERGARQAAERAIAAALLGAYQYRADRDEEHNLSVGSFMLAVAQRLLPPDQHDLLDAARCALWRMAHSQPVPVDYAAALRELAPELTTLRVCPECGTWRAHTLACSAARVSPADVSELQAEAEGRMEDKGARRG